ncbi:MAG: PAS domain S-box protein [Deltaproteobacteria bacterium]|nr:PAS domain S-box protein [Deltaproteobacteria bacterium]
MNGEPVVESKVRILVVEDELIIAKGIEKRLKLLGYAVADTVASGEEAVAKALETLPDLILMDINLQGGMDGITAADQIRSQVDIPVIFLTAYADSATLARAKISEPFGYIVKPFQDITLTSSIEMALYKHRMESRLRRSEQRLSTTLKSIGDGVIATDRKGAVSFVNTVAENLTGWRHEEAIGRYLQEIFCCIDQEGGYSCEELVTAVIQGAASRALPEQTFLISRDGKKVPIEAKATPIRDEKDIISGLVLVFTDISRRVHAEEALRRSEKLLRSIFDAIPDLFSIIDKDHRIVLSNWHGGYDYVPESLRRSHPHCYQAYYGSDRMCEPCHTVEVFQTGQPVVTEKSDPRIGYVEIRAFPIFDDAGNISLVAEHVHDITARKVAQEALAGETERLSVTLRSIGDGVITTDTAGNVVLVNKVAETLTGWSQAEAAGKPLDEVFTIIDEKTQLPAENPVGLVLSSGCIHELANHTVLVSRNGHERIIADSAAPIRDRENRIVGAVLVFRDITERRKMEEELLKAQKLESIGILAGGIAHDFNNLLTAILGNISLAKMYVSAGDKIHQKLAEAEKASLRARDLTQQLLTFSRGGAPVRKTSSIAEIIKDSTAFSLSGSNVTCTFVIPDDLWLVAVDEGQISQVINNLILNAEQSMTAGGLIEVACRNVEVGADDHLPILEGRYILVSISDQGEGISEDVLPRIFDPYFTTKEEGKGLGLSTVYSIVKNHDGHISVSTKPGAGTTFSIYLPATFGAEEPFSRQEHGAQPLEKQTVKGRVLVMDDEENIRDVVAEMLDFIGYEATLSRDGEEAVSLYTQALQSNQPFAAVLMDLTIPGGMGGGEAMRILLGINPKVKGIVSSGYSNDPILSDYASFGFQGIITKPYKLGDLRDVLKRVLTE